MRGFFFALGGGELIVQGNCKVHHGAADFVFKATLRKTLFIGFFELESHLMA